MTADLVQHGLQRLIRRRSHLDERRGEFIHDDDRTDDLRTYTAAVAEALRQGVSMAGYMVWSLMDNFEWSFGYAKRFGIVHVDYATQRRTPKDSAHW